MRADLFHLEVPMRRSFDHAEARRNSAEALILEIQYRGSSGLGECVPRIYVTGETIDLVINSIIHCDLVALFASLDFSNAMTASVSLEKWFRENSDNLCPNALCLLEMACLDLIARYFSWPLSRLLRECFLPAELVTNHSRMAMPTTQVCDFSLSVTDFLENRGPFHYVKIKVGNKLSENLNKIATVREKLGKDVAISIDANMSWNQSEALLMIRALESYGIDFFEEPLAQRNWLGYQQLREESAVKILLDESLCNYQDALTAMEFSAADAFNIRISKCGGLLNCIKLMQFAQSHQFSVQIGAQVAETGPLLSASRHLAAAVDGYFAYEAGQPDRFFEHYIVTPMSLVDRQTNMAPVLLEPGLGMHLNNNLYQYVQSQFTYNNNSWQTKNER